MFVKLGLLGLLGEGEQFDAQPVYYDANGNRLIATTTDVVVGSGAALDKPEVVYYAEGSDPSTAQPMAMPVKVMTDQPINIVSPAAQAAHDASGAPGT